MDENEFRKDLMRRQKKDYHVKFFQDDPSRQYIVVPIFSKLAEKKQITPFRNTECSKPGCVYSVDELIEKYKASNYSSMHGFICYSCNKFINLKSFFLDYTLKKMIDHIWEKHNKPDKIICKRVTIMRDGHWEPNLPEYLKYLEKNMQTSLGIPEKEQKVKGYYEGQEELQNIVQYERPPYLNEYSKDEYLELFSEFKEVRGKETDVYLERNGIPVMREDVRKVENEDGISPRVVALFVDYLNTLQLIDKGKYNKNNHNRCYFAAINLVSYDKFYRKAKYQFFFGFKNHFHKNPQQIYQEYDKLVLIFRHDDRWMTCVADLRTHKFHIVDFLSEDLSRARYEEILDIAKSVAQEEFKVKYDTHEIYDDQKLNYYSDCGMYVLNYLYKVMNNNDIEVIRIKPREKELFRRQVVWLMLRMKTLRKKTVQMFPYPKVDDNPNEAKLTPGNLQKLDRDYNQRMNTQSTKYDKPDPAKSVHLSERSVNQGASPFNQSFRSNHLGGGDGNSILKALEEDEENNRISPILKSNPQSRSMSRSIQLGNTYQGGPVKNLDVNPQRTQSTHYSNTKGDQSSYIEMNKDQLQNLLYDFKNQILTSIQEENKKKDDRSDVMSQTSSSKYLPQINGPYNQYQNPYHPNPHAFLPRNSNKLEISSDSSGSSSNSSDSDSDSDEKTQNNTTTTINNTGYSYLVGKRPQNRPKDKNESVFEYKPKNKKKGKMIEDTISEDSNDDDDSSSSDDDDEILNQLRAKLQKSKKGKVKG